ncbi:unnamed protein product [Rotaria sp. Silwood2]|nr:unnamed protein product [Rotaria sp. Silwood2]CAF2972958.1 unnamed protein product [Rotaria sp. Silwood2]CAF3394158.1 unnamed protein product [Rotaria sp. Silwood2]CAF4317735.1 unnamed protein product [Rotaria sp. Silwood2]CAF4324974.1 unnamed protein product [Rotaria sp. Silwood2]
MQRLFIQLDDLPDVILIYIFKKLYNVEVLYSLMGVNQRFNRIVHDTIFTRVLYLLKYCPDDDSTFPLPDPILDRFCSKILPEIGHQIETLFLERTSVERVLYATNYPNLNNLGLCDIDIKLAMSLFVDENPLIHIFKNQVSSLKINFNNKNNSCPMVGISSVIFQKILTIYTNLRCLKYNPSSSFGDALYLYPGNGIAICPTLLELHVSVTEMKQCLHILDGRFDQLRILYVTFDSVSPELFNIEDNVGYFY